MYIKLLKSKIHRAQVTGANCNYEGSLEIDSKIMNKVGVLPHEKILVGNITRGTRFETYAIPAPSDSYSIILNGAVAHLGKVGDLIVIMSFINLDLEAAKNWKPSVIVLGNGNQKTIKLEKQ